ncbi:CapA family protein [Cryptosporangium phraense]|uniref:CapA family protein n=1 Tax=Cryptosporangium phraense TaxID=2593070 RepID=UPI00197AC9EB|nr:CapA family protein [Cryptosporangium phraense]
MTTGVRWVAAGAAVVVLGAGYAAVRAGGSDGSFLDLTGPAASAAAPQRPAEPTVRFAAVGDVIMGSTPKLPPQGGRTFFDRVRPGLRGDVVTGNLESPLTNRTRSTKCETALKPSGDKARCFAFRVPPGYARWIGAAGFTLMNIANNHSRDYGTPGLTDTTRALRDAGVDHTGFAGQITRTSVRGIRVVVLGFSPYGWTNSVLDVPSATRLVRRAAADADLVVVNMHVGAEGADRTHVRPGPERFLGEDRGDPMRFAHAVVDAGADLVVGHSPHVLRGMEFYRGRLIAYSLGNFAGYRTLSTVGPLGIGGILRADLHRDGTWAGGSLTGTHLVDGGLPALDPRRGGVALVRRLSAADFPRSAPAIGPDGTLGLRR